MRVRVRTYIIDFRVRWRYHENHAPSKITRYTVRTPGCSVDTPSWEAEASLPIGQVGQLPYQSWEVKSPFLLKLVI